MIKILYIDDENDLLELGKIFLERSKEFLVDGAASASAGQQMLERSHYDAVISDYQMPVMTGIDFLKQLRSRGNQIPFILFTGRGREEVVIEALNSGADFYVQKGGNPLAQFTELGHKVKEVVRRTRTEEALHQNEKKLSKAQAIGHTGCWEYDWIAFPGMIWGSEEGFKLFGLNHPSGTVPFSVIESCIPEKDRVHQALKELIELGKRYDLIYLVNPADGSPPRLINSVAEMERDGQGNPLKVVGVIKDITESRKAEDSLKKDQARNRVLFELAQMSGLTPKDIAKKTLDHSIELTNSQMGYIAFLNDDATILTMQYFSGDVMDKCGVQDRLSGVKMESTGLWAEAIRQRKPVITNDYDAPNPMKKGLPQGHVMIKRHMSIPVFDRGRVVAVAGVGNKESEYTEEDATDIALLMDGMWRIIRKIEAEEELRESEKRFRDFVELSTEEQYLVDEEGRVIECNPKACEILEKSREEILSMWVWDLVFLFIDDGRRTKESYDHIKHQFELALRTGECPLFSEPVVIDHLLPDGSRRHGQMISFPIRTESGWRIGLSIWDMTAHRTIEEELRASKLQLTMATDLAQLVYWEYDVNTDIYTLNDRFYSLYGTDAEKEGGYMMSRDTYYRDFVHPDDIRYVTEVAERAPDYRGDGLHLEHRIIRRDGEIRHVSVFPCQIKDEEGKILKVFGVNQDITELKKVEESLRKANEKLSLLSSITRHDIMNQLTIQMSYLGSVRGMIANPEAIGRLQKVEESVKVVQKQIEFTRDYETMGSSSPQWHSVEDVILALPDLNDAKHLEIDDSVRGLLIYADPMFSNVFHNLVENSIRYCGQALDIAIRCEVLNGELLLIYEDKGIGIAENEKKKIFLNGYGKGTGLGLFLSSEILAITGI